MNRDFIIYSHPEYCFTTDEIKELYNLVYYPYIKELYEMGSGELNKLRYL